MKWEKRLWTPELIERLKAASIEGLTVAEVAQKLNLTEIQTRNGAYRHKIKLVSKRYFHRGNYEKARNLPITPEWILRARWEKIIPNIKSNLVRELQMLNLITEDKK